MRAGPGKVWLLVQAPAGAAPPPGFRLKPALRLALRKGVHITLALGDAALQQEAQQQAQQQAQLVEGGGALAEAACANWPAAPACASAGGGRQSVWLQSKWVLRSMCKSV